ncbi:MAG: tetratricopeptide repeat protein [Gemmatimonadota bacterium]
MSFFEDLKQRRVVRATGIYLAGAFAVLQGVQLLVQSLHLPDWIMTVLTISALVALPIVIATVAWDNQRAFAYGTVGVIVALVGVGAYAYIDHGDVDTAATESIPSIAVLPFVNMSDDREQEYFSDGLTEELLNSLVQMQNLRVAARTSSFAFKDKQVPVAEIGKTLNVGNVLEGSVRRGGNKLRITAQLINVANGYHIWSKTYDRELTDVFAIQEEIARAITDALKVSFGARGETKVPEHDVDAYNLYLQGRFFWNQRTSEGLEKARLILGQAVKKDSAFARAWAALADAYTLSAEYGDMPIDVANREALRAARRAIELDSTLAEPHATLGNIYSHLYEWEQSFAEYQTAIKLNPAYPTAHQWYAWALSCYGDLHGALREIETALKLDPLSQIINNNYAQHLSAVGRRAEGIAQVRRTIELAPDFRLAKATLAMLLALDGQQDESAAVADEYMASPGSKSRHALGAVALAYAKAGQRTRALAVLRAFDSDPRAFSAAPAWIALGDTARAFRLMKESIAIRDPSVIFSAGGGFDPIRNTAQYRALRKMMNL